MRTVFLSNGSLAVLHDENCYIRDIYYPLLGQHYHHSFGGRFKIGIWHDSRFTWLESIGNKEIKLNGSKAELHAQRNGLDIRMEDTVLIPQLASVRRISIRPWLREGNLLL